MRYATSNQVTSNVLDALVTACCHSQGEPLRSIITQFYHAENVESGLGDLDTIWCVRPSLNLSHNRVGRLPLSLTRLLSRRRGSQGSVNTSSRHKKTVAEQSAAMKRTAWLELALIQAGNAICRTNTISGYLTQHVNPDLTHEWAKHSHLKVSERKIESIYVQSGLMKRNMENDSLYFSLLSI